MVMRLLIFALSGIAIVPARAQSSTEAGTLAQAAAAVRAEQLPDSAIWLESIDLGRMSQRRGLPRAGRSIRDLPISLGGVTYPHGIGTRSISEFVIDLKGAAVRFASMAGLDDAVKNGVGTVTFEVWADDRLVAASGLIRAGDAPKLLSADVSGARVLTLLLDDGGDTSNDDEAAWAGAVLFLVPGTPSRPEPYTPSPEAPPAIAPAEHSPRPLLHGPRVTGATPGRPFLFRVPATGAAPLRFEAIGLPVGVTIDTETGIIKGSIRDAGTCSATIWMRAARQST